MTGVVAGCMAGPEVGSQREETLWHLGREGSLGVRDESRTEGFSVPERSQRWNWVVSGSALRA